MTQVKMSIDLPASADAVWGVIGRYAALAEWHPAIAACKETSEDGQTIRYLTLEGGGSITERLEDHDDGARTYSYAITESPLPVKDYVARLTVHARGSDGCTVEWGSRFEPAGASEADAEGVIQGIYQAGFDSLKARFPG